MNKPIFRSAITDENGDVDVGYLALIWGLIGWAIAVMTVLSVGVFVAWFEAKTGAATIQSMGVAVGAVSGGFATMLGAVGLFRLGDKPRAEAALLPGKTTTTEKTVETVTPASATPVNPVPVQVINKEPVPVTETPPGKARKGKR